jgi:hypothetical protein
LGEIIMGVAETVSTAFLDIVNGLTPDLDSLYSGSHNYVLSDWKLQQNAMVGASGAVAVAIPGLHLAGLAADVAFVLNRMSVATYGTGAILGSQAGLGNIIESEDFAAVLGYWSHDDGIMHAMSGKGASGVVKVGAIAGKVVVKKGLTKAMLLSSGYLVGQRLGGKALAKARACG